MTALDGIFGPLTASLLGQFGKSITYLHDPAIDDEDTGGTLPAGKKWKGLVPAIIEEYRGVELIDGSRLSTDKKLSIAGAALPIDPTPGDTVIIDDTTYTVMAVNSIYSGAEVALYVLQCRAS